MLHDISYVLCISLATYIGIYRMMGKIFHMCKNHIKDDHLLLRLLVCLSSDNDIDILLDNAPIHIVALHIAGLWWRANNEMKEVTRSN